MSRRYKLKERSGREYVDAAKEFHPNSVKQRSRLIKKYAEVFNGAIGAFYNAGGYLTDVAEKP